MISYIIVVILLFFLIAFIAIYKTRNQATKSWKNAIISRPDYTKVEHKWVAFNSNGLYYCNVRRIFLNQMKNNSVLQKIIGRMVQSPSCGV